MRELKFRFWDTINKCWHIHGWNKDNTILKNEYFIDQNGKVRELNYDSMDTLEYVIVQQFTVATDMNGIDIYDGDIIKYKKEFIGYVEFFAGMHILSFSDQTDNGPVQYLQTLDMEVIGNIFETPELLR